MNTHRQIVKAIDIQIFFGKSQGMSNKMLRTIRKALNKEKHQPITIGEFCTVFKITDAEPLIRIIISNDHTKTPKRSTAMETPITKAPSNTEVPLTNNIINQLDEPYKFAEKPWLKQI